METTKTQQWLLESTDKVQSNSGHPISNLLYFIWSSRPDLQRNFDLNDRSARLRLCEWFLVHGSLEYGLRGWAYPPQLLRALATEKGVIGDRARALLKADQPSIEKFDVLEEGANLIGYVRSEFGMGEHVRAVAESLGSVGGRFSIVDLPGAGVHGITSIGLDQWTSNRPDNAANIFHVNADIFPTLIGRVGSQIFEDRYNVGFWAWELAKCPPHFRVSISMVDEIWAISEFVRQAFSEISSVPVISMPMAVEVPRFESTFCKEDFGFKEDDFVFLFTFDAASHLARKNPLAVIRAFKAAFPIKSARVRLLMKTMNVAQGDRTWASVAKEAASDSRIIILDRRLERNDILGLYRLCDAFVSLHRSEGFGRCIAEAMAFGKPVIATGYSGSNDFVNETTACVVDYTLVPVEREAYPYWRGQTWAEPDVEDAARHMHRIFLDRSFRDRIAKVGQVFVKENFNRKVVGARYLKRLEKVLSRRAMPTPGLALSELATGPHRGSASADQNSPN